MSAPIYIHLLSAQTLIPTPPQHSIQEREKEKQERGEREKESMMMACASSSSSSSPVMEKKRKIGGKRSGKVVMQKLDCKKKRQITFTKRRGGITSKVSEICSLFDGAQFAFIAQSEGKNFFTYAKRELDTVIDGFLGHSDAQAQPAAAQPAAAQPAAAREFEECDEEEQARRWLEVADGRFVRKPSVQAMNMKAVKVYEEALVRMMERVEKTLAEVTVAEEVLGYLDMDSYNSSSPMSEIVDIQEWADLI